MSNLPDPRSVMLRETGLRSRTGGATSSAPADAARQAARPWAADNPPAPARGAGSGGRKAGDGDRLIGMGRSQGILAITVIVVLSAGLGLLFYFQLRQSSMVADVVGDPDGLLGGFGFLMLLTVIYLVSKHWTTSRTQSRMIDQILEEESVARALRQNPITDYHHPEVCRDILLQQASHAARLHSPLSLLELHIAGLGKLSAEAGMQPKIAELIRQIKGLCRATDSVLRWTPDSFLLAFPEVTRDELGAISERLRQELERWIEEHYDPGARPALQWRGATSTSLDSGGDILLETQRLLERESRLADRKAEPGRGGPAKREKSIALAIELEIQGEDRNKNLFQTKIVTERLAADRFWCELNQDLGELSPLTVTAPDGTFSTPAVLARWLERSEDRLAEIQFIRTPERWVIRSEP